jgi:hypothetical protein
VIDFAFVKEQLPVTLRKDGISWSVKLSFEDHASVLYL